MKINIITITLMALLSLFVTTSNASENLIISTVSHHSGTFEYDNNNFGVGFEKEVGNNTWMGFVSYNNSYSKISTMVFAAKRLEVGSFNFGASIGIANNYEDDMNSTDSGFLVIPLLTAEAPITDQLGIRLSTSAPFSKIAGGDTVTNLSFIIKQ